MLLPACLPWILYTTRLYVRTSMQSCTADIINLMPFRLKHWIPHVVLLSACTALVTSWALFAPQAAVQLL